MVAVPYDSCIPAVTIDGRPAPVHKAYNDIYGNTKRTFLGSYLDPSALQPDQEHVLEAEIPPLAPGRFQGLFFENVEPEYTNIVIR